MPHPPTLDFFLVDGAVKSYELFSDVHGAYAQHLGFSLIQSLMAVIVAGVECAYI